MQFDKPEPWSPSAPENSAVRVSGDASDAALSDSVGSVRPRRTALCACGSGRRYKHCCGVMSATADAAATLRGRQAAIVNDAVRLMNAGEAVRAEQVLCALQACEVHDARVALETGAIYFDLHCLPLAEHWLARARELDRDHSPISDAFAELHKLATRRTTWQTAARDICALLECLQARAHQGARSAQVHIVCRLDAIGGSERRALNLYRCLSAHAAHVRLWSTTPALPALADMPIQRIAADSVPSEGTVIVVGTYFDCGDWLQTQPFERIVICHNLSEQHASLLRRLQQIEANPSRPQVELTFPSALFRAVSGLPGTVEYSPVDTGYFDGSRQAVVPGTPLRIGRHGRAYPWKFHPNDPAFFRTLIALGHAVRILGGSIIADAFVNDAAQPELLDVGAADAREFLGSLDVFVYRKHPHFFETGGTVILEAMAMQLPVVVFAEDCGYAEVIRHGENGFIVADEAQALACIERLHADPDLRARLGAAARTTVVELMRAQESSMIDYYLGAASY